MQYFLLFFIGISSGALVAAGLFAFIVAIGIVNRIASRTGTSRHLRCYESSAIAGGVIFNLLYLFSNSIPFGYVGLIIFGLFSGLFIGLQAFALAEVIKTFPILAIRIKLTEGIPYIILAMSLGKVFGSLLGFLYS